MRIDVNAFLGAYPYRRVPGTSPEAVLAAMDRVSIDEAWATHLPGIFWRDPHDGNRWLLDTCGRNPRLRPVPAVQPEMAGWRRVLDAAREAGAPAVRSDPTFYGIAPAGQAMRTLAAACGDLGLPLALAVRLEDGRQRHPSDGGGELPAAAVRALVRSSPTVRLLVTHADRPFIEEVHFGSTPEEARRIWWDISWVWGPPEDHLQTLLGTIGPERFVFGTGQPLRIPENGIAKLDLLDLDPAARGAVEAENAGRLRRGGGGEAG
ncbi:MAG TPA: amidohydrolase family protein [Gemmatimonadales bacterium]|nr:amidohydrolase family protein [Gemmatimonadales bacterium]